MISTTAALFANHTFGWPTIDSVDLPGSGPNYPLATPGVRVQFDLASSFSLLAAVFNGNPAGPGKGEPEARNRYGVNFRVSDPPFWIGEAQYKYNREKNATGLPGTVRLGGWYHDAVFDSVSTGTDRLSLAVGNGIPARLRGDWGVYGIVDQQVWRLSDKDPDKGANVFVRIMGSPSDLNEIDFCVDGGITFTGIIPQRSNDDCREAILADFCLGIGTS